MISHFSKAFLGNRHCGCQLYTVSQKNWATFIFTVTLSNVGRF